MYTTAQARQLLKVDAKTFLKWLEKDSIEPQRDKADNRIKLFTWEQLEQLAEAHGRVLPSSLEQETGAAPDKTMDRIDAMEALMEALEQRLEALEQAVARLTELMQAKETPKRLKPAEANYSAIAEAKQEIASSLPGDLELLAHFAKRHSKDGAPPTTVKRFAEEVGAPKDTKDRWLADERVKALFSERFHTRGWFQEQDCCPHPS